ncbi:MAG: hypothetical protein R3A80_03260 [Bdellovibrionota bacterium]
MRVLFFLIFILSANVEAKKPVHTLGDLSAEQTAKVFSLPLNELPRSKDWRLQLNAEKLNGNDRIIFARDSKRVCYVEEKTFSGGLQTRIITSYVNAPQPPSEQLSCCFEFDQAKKQTFNFETTQRGNAVSAIKSLDLIPETQKDLDGREYTSFKVLRSDPDIFKSLECSLVKEGDRLRSPTLFELKRLFGNDFAMKPDAL